MDHKENDALKRSFSGKHLHRLLPSNDRIISRQTHRLSFDRTRTIKEILGPTIHPLLHIFIAVGHVYQVAA
jgi:hypothetical protein